MQSPIPTAIPVPIAPPNGVQQYQLKESTPLSEQSINELKRQGFSHGLASSLTANNVEFPLRIWVVDNSGSMQKADGHRIIPTRKKNELKIVDSTRWDEIRDCCNYHIEMSALLEAPTSFRLLNNPGASVGSQQFDVAQMGREHIRSDVSRAHAILTRTRPNGVTPLTEHIDEIYSTVNALGPSLNAEGKRVVIVIATDGLPTDAYGNHSKFEQDRFIRSLRALEGLPVWLVVRLCTDDDEVVNFYNDLDEMLEISMDVLDDFVGEAHEVHEHNKWLNYALPLHRMREMGFHDRVFDMLDERTLTKGELRDFCMLLFGVDNFDGVSDPNVDWHGFMSSIDYLLKKEELQYDPVKKRMAPWINLQKLNKMYGDGSSCVIM